MPSAFYITKKITRFAMSKNQRKHTLREDINWVWGWAGIGILWVIGHIIVGVSSLFS
jgi:hypothetical protein